MFLHPRQLGQVGPWRGLSPLPGFLGAPDAPLGVEAEVPAGYAGTARTLDAMHALTLDAARDERVVNLARAIVAPLPRRDHAAEAAALLAWTQTNLRYVRDPLSAERLMHPVATLFEARAGDCDDLAMALAALGAAIGTPYAFRAVGRDPLRPNDLEHVYVLFGIGDRWVPADPMFEHELGWEPPLDDGRAGPLRAPTPGAAVWRRDSRP